MPKSRLLKLFDAAAINLADIENTNDMNRIRCPLCLRYFGREAIDAKQLTEEHIIPRSVGGGRLITITCKPCNNRHGSRLDAQTAAAAKASDALAGRRALRSRVDIGTGHFRANVTLSPDPAVMSEIVVVQKASDPRKMQEAMDALRSGTCAINLHFSFGYNTTQLWLALLRAAYLNSFRLLGYGYILSPFVTELRRQINADDPPSEVLEKLITSIPLDKPLPSAIHQFDLWSSLGLPAYLTLLQTRLEEVVTFAALIPCAATRSEGSLEQLAEVAGALKGGSMRISWW